VSVTITPKRKPPVDVTLPLLSRILFQTEIKRLVKKPMISVIHEYSESRIAILESDCELPLRSDDQYNEHCFAQELKED